MSFNKLSDIITEVNPILLIFNKLKLKFAPNNHKINLKKETKKTNIIIMNMNLYAC